MKKCFKQLTIKEKYFKNHKNKLRGKADSPSDRFPMDGEGRVKSSLLAVLFRQAGEGRRLPHHDVRGVDADGGARNAAGGEDGDDQGHGGGQGLAEPLHEDGGRCGDRARLEGGVEVDGKCVTRKRAGWSVGSCT